MHWNIAMISYAVAFALLVTAAPADPAKMPRKDYVRCLQNETRSKLEAKTPAEAFDQAVGSACAASEAAFKAALVSANMASGLKRQEAEEEAKIEAADYLANAKDMYREYQETETKPEN